MLRMCDKCSCDNPPPGYVPASLIPGGLVPDIPLIPSLVFRNIGVELSMRSDIRDQIQGIIDQKLHSVSRHFMHTLYMYKEGGGVATLCVDPPTI